MKSVTDYDGSCEDRLSEHLKWMNCKDDSAEEFEEQWDDFSSWRHDSGDNLLLLDENGELIPSAHEHDDDNEGCLEYDQESPETSSCDLRADCVQAKNEAKEQKWASQQQVRAKAVSPRRRIKENPESDLKNSLKLSRKIKSLPLPEKPCAPLQVLLSGRTGGESPEPQGERSSSVGQAYSESFPWNSDESSKTTNMNSKYGVRSGGFQIIRESSYSILDRRRRAKAKRVPATDSHPDQFLDAPDKETWA